MKNIVKKQSTPKKDWLKIEKGKTKFKHEFLLNYTVNNWNFNQSIKVGKTSELIRKCSPENLKQWKTYYFKNAIQKKINGERINRKLLKLFGKEIFDIIKQKVKKQIEEISVNECIDYIHFLVINRTYDGYLREKETVYDFLNKKLKVKFTEGNDELDRKYNVDFTIKIKNKYIGLQIKPNVEVYSIESYYKEKKIQQKSHQEFLKTYKGKVFYVVSIDKKIFDEKNLLKEIKEEIARLKKLK